MHKLMVGMALLGVLASPTAAITTAELPKGTVLLTGPTFRDFVVGLSISYGDLLTIAFYSDNQVVISQAGFNSSTTTGRYKIFRDRVCSDRISITPCIFVAQVPNGQYLIGMIPNGEKVKVVDWSPWKISKSRARPQPKATAQRTPSTPSTPIAQQGQVYATARIERKELVNSRWAAPICRLNAIEQCWIPEERRRR